MIIIIITQRPVNASKFLYIVFEKLNRLQPGNYLLRHQTGDSSAIVYQSIGTEEGKEPTNYSFDLHDYIKRSGTQNPDFVHFIPKLWLGPPNQIPFTFIPSPATHLLYPNHCHSFLKQGMCTKFEVLFFPFFFFFFLFSFFFFPSYFCYLNFFFFSI